MKMFLNKIPVSEVQNAPLKQVFLIELMNSKRVQFGVSNNKGVLVRQMGGGGGRGGVVVAMELTLTLGAMNNKLPKNCIEH